MKFAKLFEPEPGQQVLVMRQDEGEGPVLMKRIGFGSPWSQDGMMQAELNDTLASQIAMRLPQPPDSDEGEAWKEGG